MIDRVLLVLMVATFGVLAITPRSEAQRGNPVMAFAGQSIDAMIADFMAENDIPGMALAIVQAPYIPRVTGYGLADTGKRLLASSNTLFDIGQMANAYTAVAVMQLVEMGKLRLDDPIGAQLRDLPEAWRPVTVRQLLTHASGITDGDEARALAFRPGTQVAYNATDAMLLERLVEAASGERLRDFVRTRQFDVLGLRHTLFADDIARVRSEAVDRTDNRHRQFLVEAVFINPTERATGYTGTGEHLVPAPPGRGSATILASAMDISVWDIGLAGGILVKDPALRAILYNPATLADGRSVPVMGEWRFPGRKGLMYVTGNANGQSAFLSRFTDPAELVCVTLLANKADVDLSQLGRKIAGAYDARLGPPPADRMRLQQSPYPVRETLERYETMSRSDGLAMSARAWEQDGQVWIGYADDTKLAPDLRSQLDRLLLRAVTPY